LSGTAPLRLEDADALRAAASRFGGPHAREKAALLGAAAGRPFAGPEALLAWHDALLFLLAHPETRDLRDAARRALDGVEAASRAVAERGPDAWRDRLAGHGIAWSSVTVTFGWDLARWLARRFPHHAELARLGARRAPLGRILQGALSPLEVELVASTDGDAPAFLDEATSGVAGSRLSWLVAHLERLACPDELRQVLWESLVPYLTIRPGGSILSRTRARGLPAPTFFHREPLLRGPGGELAKVLDDPLPRARRLSPAERTRLLDAARAMLAALGRETDAVSLADPRGVAWHDVGRGAAVALFTAGRERHEPLDAHVGMMLFKNGLPVGYGGGWPFLGTCRIGVNIFEAYRGGESAFLFAQVLRVYRQRFGVRRFVAEPSQFGGGDLEGLRSGAFWFYYRLGFRPVGRRAAALARAESERMRAEPGYRTPLPALRRFTRSDMQLAVEGGLPPGPTCEPAHLSHLATVWIAGRFGGDRAAAEAFASRKVARALRLSLPLPWPEPERRALRALALLFAQVEGLGGWPATDRRALVALVRSKGRDELRFHRLLARSPRIATALAELAARLV